MNKSEKNILKETILNEVEKSLYLLEEKIANEKDGILKKYVDLVAAIVNRIGDIQQSRDIVKISGIFFILSRINITHNNYAYPIFLFNENDYLDMYNDELEIDVSFFYEALDEIKQSTMAKCKSYTRDNINITDIEQELYQHLKYFNMFFVYMLREVFQQEAIKKSLRLIEKSDLFVVLQGELSEKPYCICEIKKEEGEKL